MQKVDAVSSRRRFLKSSVRTSAAAILCPTLATARAAAPNESSDSAVPEVTPFELDEITIGELQDGMKSGRFTSRLLVEKYTQRIEEVDKNGPKLNSIIEMNPDAPAIADSLDRERQAKGPRGANDKSCL